MFVIKVGNKKIKLLNWLIFIMVILLIIYLLGTLLFTLPIFSKTYNYEIEKENYKINNKVIFKNAWLNCNIKEEYKVIIKDSDIKKYLSNDLIKDGFNKKKDNIFIRRKKSFGVCRKKIEKYDNNYKNNHVKFKLIGSTKEEILYKEEYKDPYVIAKVNGKDVKKIDIYSNLNNNKIGKYIISYTLNISNGYKERLYRKIEVKDKEKPVITLDGEEKLELDYGSSYKEPGFKAEDNYDGDITDMVKIKNSVNTKKPGTYYVHYKVSDSSLNKTIKKRTVIVKEKNVSVSKESPKIEVKDGITYVDGIILVNKDYALPKSYDPKVNNEALKALKNMQADGKAIGLNLPLVSGYRSYETQEKLYNKYVKQDGEEEANTYSAKPGHSEHQTGLAFDIGSVDRSFQNTNEAKWIEENAHIYGFIVRYPKGKTDITGYIYEPWHIRYLGKEIAKKVKESGLTLEEYLGVK